MLTYIIYIIIAILFVAFFSGAETAFTSINFMKLVHLIEKKDKRALLVHDLLKRPDKLLVTTLVGTNLFIVVASALATHFTFQFIPRYAFIFSIFVMTPLILIFGELIPKIICQNKSNKISLIIAPWVLLSRKILSPIVSVITFITNILLNMIGPRTIKKNPFLTKDEIKILIRDVTKEGMIEDYEKDVIDKIFDFTLTKAADIMVSLKDVAFVECGNTREEVIVKSKSLGFTRLPVFENKNIKGIVNIFDILYKDETSDWHGFIRPLRTVSFDDRLDVVFSAMQPNKEAMVTVLKENKIIGILTMEDLIQEIVAKTNPITSQLQNER